MKTRHERIESSQKGEASSLRHWRRWRGLQGALQPVEQSLFALPARLGMPRKTYIFVV